MKNTARLRAACIGAWLCAAAAAPAADGKKSSEPCNVRIDVLMVAMPQEKFAALLPDLLDSGKIEKAVPALLEAVKRKEMILEGYPVVVAKAGQTGSSDATLQLHNAENQDWSGYGGRSVWEDRDFGISLSVQPFVSPDGKVISTEIWVEHTGLLEHPADAENVFPPDGDPQLAPPKYFTRHIFSSISLLNGRHLLIGAHKMTQPGGFVEVFIAHAQTLSGDFTAVKTAESEAYQKLFPRSLARISMLMVSMPQEKFAALAPDLLDKDKIEKAVPEILDAVKRKEMVLEGCPIIVTKLGERAKDETTTDNGLFPIPVKDPYVGSPPSYMDIPLGLLLDDITLFLRPDDGKIYLNAQIQRTDLLGYETFSQPNRKVAASNAMGSHNTSVQPIYFKMSTDIGLSLLNGRHLLFAVHKKEKPAGSVEIFILQTEMLPVGD